MADQDSGKHEAKLFGFTRAEWAAADALDVENFDDWLEGESIPGSPWPGWMMIGGTQWLRLGRLSPLHAARVLHVIGPTWQQWATARRERIPDLIDPDLRLDFIKWAEEYEAVLAELRSLAGTQGGS